MKRIFLCDIFGHNILGSSFKKILNWGKYFLRIADEISKVKGYE